MPESAAWRQYDESKASFLNLVVRRGKFTGSPARTQHLRGLQVGICEQIRKVLTVSGKKMLYNVKLIGKHGYPDLRKTLVMLM